VDHVMIASGKRGFSAWARGMRLRRVCWSETGVKVRMRYSSFSGTLTREHALRSGRDYGL
jgi:hypothetical protein